MAGNPGGAISVQPTGAGLPVFFVAPVKFLGDQSSLVGRALSFDLLYDYPVSGGSFYTPQIVLQGAGLTLLGSSERHAIGNGWHDFKTFLTVDDRGWSVDDFTGPTATLEQFTAVMSDLASVYIHADLYLDIPGTVTLDNVAIIGIPEPNLAALFGLGTATLLLVLGRRRSSSTSTNALLPSSGV